MLPRQSIHAVFYGLVQQGEIETVWEIEKQGAVIVLVFIIPALDFLGYEGFPPDETDSLEWLRYVFLPSLRKIS